MRQPYLFIFVGFAALLLGVGLRLNVELNKEFSRVDESYQQLAVVLEQRVTSHFVKKFLGADGANKEKTAIFVGDIMLDRVVGLRMERSGDFRYPFLRIADITNSADLVFGNLEGPISRRGSNQGSAYSFRAVPEVIDGLVYAGFDILSLANNHIWDWGAIALKDTINFLKDRDIQPVGAGQNELEANASVIVDWGDDRIAFLAYTNLYPETLEAGPDSPGISSFDVEEIQDEIKAMKNSGEIDIVTVSLHWGDEYHNRPSTHQQIVAHLLIEAGADLIIGHHPHVVQEIEKYRDGWIMYSLGNFVFDQNFSEETMNGLMVKVTIEDGRIKNFEPIKIRISETYQPYISH